MSTMHRIKAYFGMVPADELDEYDPDYRSDYPPDYDAYYDRGYDRPADEADRVGHPADRAGDRAADRADPRRDRRRSHPERLAETERVYSADRVSSRRPGRAEYAAREAARSPAADYDEEERPVRTGGRTRVVADNTQVRGALAVDTAARAATRPTPRRESGRATSPRMAPVADAAASAVSSAASARAPESSVEPVQASRQTMADNLARIVTFQPRNYNEARPIGERYREGTPVIMNLTEMADADAKRLVDFAAGLALALHGDIDKITHKVFLLSPPNVDVTADDKRQIAEGGFFNQS